MFKNKIIIYLKNGAIIKVRGHHVGDSGCVLYWDNKNKMFRTVGCNVKNKELAAVYIKKWWEPWGIV